MKTELFNYALPKERIAQFPKFKRGNSNLLVLDRLTGEIEHKKYYNVIDYIEPEDTVVLNNTKVIYARIFGQPENKQAKIEVLLLHPFPNPYDIESKTWEALIGNHKRLNNQNIIRFSSEFYCEIIKETSNKTFLLKFNLTPIQFIEKNGHIPLPKYIKREDNNNDKDRYQTVFANKQGSVAAPTASLNLTEDILNKIKEKGANIEFVTLWIGWGTFAPIKTENIEDFQIHSEYCELNSQTARNILNTKNKGKKIIAFGTTVTRVLEGIYKKKKTLEEYKGEIDLFIYPPYTFNIIDRLITNFHAPKTTVLLMACAFAGKENLFNAYQEALNKNYEFLSYGDSMLIK